MVASHTYIEKQNSGHKSSIEIKYDKNTSRVDRVPNVTPESIRSGKYHKNNILQDTVSVKTRGITLSFLLCTFARCCQIRVWFSLFTKCHF